MKKKTLETKVLKFKPLRDDNNKRFIPYCDFGFHQGYILTPNICEQRRCSHYLRLYLKN